MRCDVKIENKQNSRFSLVRVSLRFLGVECRAFAAMMGTLASQFIPARLESKSEESNIETDTKSEPINKLLRIHYRVEGEYLL
jgi:hypothetical protein